MRRITFIALIVIGVFLSGHNLQALITQALI